MSNPISVPVNRRRAAAWLAASCAGTLVLGLAGPHAHAQGAQDYPNRPVRIIVPQSPGAGTDVTTRWIAERLAQEWKVQVIVDNKPGAGVTIGTDAAAKAAPDGYTLFMGGSAVYLTKLLSKSVPFDAVKDFRVLMGINDALLALVVPANLPVNTVGELVAYAKARPGKLSFGSAGGGSVTYIAPALMAKMGGLDVVSVPYKGSGPLVTDTISGQIQFSVPAIATAAPHVASGRLKALAVTGARRSKAMPQVPTMAESGFDGFEVTSKTYLAAPAGLPDAIAEKIVAAVGRIIATPDYQRFLDSQGLEAESVAPRAYAASVQEELRRWQKVVDTIGLKPE
jgi:tripartite-type tricarboxylate transporter receptor subunit TctC